METQANKLTVDVQRVILSLCVRIWRVSYKESDSLQQMIGWIHLSWVAEENIDKPSIFTKCALRLCRHRQIS